jgi:pyrimidine-specific ribonucleoside hydrolase
MNLVIETDIGRDPDDLFAIAYLLAVGVNVRAILISPGDRDQVAIARLLLDRTGVSVPIGVAKQNRTSRSSGGIHAKLLKRHGRELEADPDGDGPTILARALMAFPDCEAFVIGPVTSVGNHLRSAPTAFSRATMQGGFLGYHQHQFTCPTIEKFDGADWQDTFNLNGDRKAADVFLNAAIPDRRMVGKNVCHTVWFDADIRARLRPQLAVRPDAAEFFAEAADVLLAVQPSKKFHDPTAAACHLHPEIGRWARGRTVRKERGWGTDLHPDGDHILAAVDYDALWECLTSFR